ncbi:MAG: hypothetical protein JJT81_12855, partial [Rubellimicrobium sp.]|nr:hypothetical protein [Rubellimicrobium sp.]
EAEDVAEPAEDASPALESREPEPAEAPLVAADLDPEADETPQEDETPAAAPPEHFAGQPDEAEPIPSVEDPEEGADDPATDGSRRMPLRTVAPEIAEILRQEAEREQAARRAEAEAGIETQPDLGLDQLMADEERRAAEARERLARLRGTPSPDPAPSTSTPAPATPVTAPQTTLQDDESELPVAPSRRGLLPDIEEINSTLSSAPERPTSTAEAEEERRGGFRLGFGSILLVAALLALAYAFAPEIVANVPQTEPVLAPYVSTIDEARLWLDLRLQDLLNRMEAPPDGG